ncbi:elongation factor 2 [Lactuca sativa]|uniref:elongation factor 2 n=1 Tax=Lactuca sativa TaxID=4236 RepID=UPI0022AF490B|nr:elongation factor 2 [Lactuca sativa]
MLVEIAVALLVGVGIVAAPPSASIVNRPTSGRSSPSGLILLEAFNIPNGTKSKAKAKAKVKFTADEVRKIRLFNLIGKSTLNDSLVAFTGSIPEEGVGDFTIKSTNTSIYYEMTESDLKAFEGEHNGRKYIINLIDSPGHIEFSGEVNAALRITDGALAVVDCSEGVCIQTKNVIRHALLEGIRPALTVNKMETCFLDCEADSEEVYKTLEGIINEVNATIDINKVPQLDDVTVSPAKGNVAFSSGIHGWAFTLKYFAEKYALEFDVDVPTMMERLWGDNYFNLETQTWSKKRYSSRNCKRGFVQFCYKPIMAVIGYCMNDQKDRLLPVLKELGVTLTSKEKKLVGRELVKSVMRKWFPAPPVLLKMMVFHLPSPCVAQKYRVEILYEGPKDDKYAEAIRNCDPNGPLMLYVSKMIPASEDTGRFWVLGRVFAGRVSTGMKVGVLGSNYAQHKDFSVTIVEKTAICIGKKQGIVKNVPCGNTVLMLLGLDQFITKNATITSEKETEAYPMRTMRLSAVPVVCVAVRCKVASDLPKLMRGLECLAKTDPIFSYTQDSARHVISCGGVLHLKICLDALKDSFLDGTEIDISAPFVSFSETVVSEVSPSDDDNLLGVRATPLGVIITYAIEDRLFGPNDDQEGWEACTKYMCEEPNWDKNFTKRIWCFGGTNILIGGCKEADYSNDFKKAVIEGFQQACRAGGLAGETMRGICFEILCDDPMMTHDLDLDELIITARDAVLASQLTAGPRLMEPIFLVEIQAYEQSLEKIKSVFQQRRGWFRKMRHRTLSRWVTFEAYIPVRESFELYDAFKSLSLKASPQCVFSHWGIIDSDPMEDNSLAHKLIEHIHERKAYMRQMTPP